ncbi:Hypothetical protein NTJ_02485 [Nesidiocoris tenuis]|uniref:Uncharacterized protein n=1 Tax=Nesidiocoris tenuis TaxID=355587 RepID=A0ABN7ACE5_9HEMI|nr:Hypothetical protein NTJ_02485 [Nesidiocoris tenuis]
MRAEARDCSRYIMQGEPPRPIRYPTSVGVGDASGPMSLQQPQTVEDALLNVELRAAEDKKSISLGPL